MYTRIKECEGGFSNGKGAENGRNFVLKKSSTYCSLAFKLTGMGCIAGFYYYHFFFLCLC